ncbi:queuosine precursor transporter [Aestuariimicrobium ganziense]|uniref:queuosine precursor transporter n=1 Tax=Aestuariimicrobium ganziense TaxID=2773677 RepID=UPI002E296D34|nr:queuosine precursor transporter [Aestuariimicrobium ganziense]
MTTTTRPAVYASRAGARHFDLLLTAMCVVIILSNIGASKGVQLGPVVTDGGFFLFPAAYILGDVISEVYGPRAARRSIIAGFACSVLAVLTFWVVLALPGLGDDQAAAKQAALEGALGPVWQIVLASALGFVVGQTSNALVMVRMKSRFGERGLAARLMASTGVGEFLDTLVFCSVAATAIGISSWGQWANYVAFGFLWKTAVEYLLVPVTSRVIGAIKRSEPSYREGLLR